MITAQGRPHLSIVIPAHDEQDRIGSTLASVGEYVRARRIDAEILVVDDGSGDGTGRVAAAALQGTRGRVLTFAENRGKGNAVRQGLLCAEGRWVLFTDADLSTPIEEHAKLAAAARDRDLDVVIGSRALPGSRVEVRQARLREAMGRTFNRLIRLFTRLEFRDTQCGFKLMDRERVLPLFERMVVDGFAFDVELLFLCVRFGLRVGEVPVVWRDSARTSLSLVADPPRMIADLVRLRWRFRRGLYNPRPVAADVDPVQRSG